jgi:hypothetical protein
MTKYIILTENAAMISLCGTLKSNPLERCHIHNLNIAVPYACLQYRF